MMDLVDNKEEIAEKNLKRFVILFTLYTMHTGYMYIVFIN
jgi:hypothetical protein